MNGWGDIMLPLLMGLCLYIVMVDMVRADEYPPQIKQGFDYYYPQFEKRSDRYMLNVYHDLMPECDRVAALLDGDELPEDARAAGWFLIGGCAALIRNTRQRGLTNEA